MVVSIVVAVCVDIVLSNNFGRGAYGYGSGGDVA